MDSAAQQGNEYLSAYAQINIEYCASDESESQITKYDQIYQIVHQFKPSIIINYSAWSDVDQLKENNELANAVNRDAVRHLTISGTPHVLN